MSATTIEFTPVARAYPLTNDLSRRFLLICRAIITTDNGDVLRLTTPEYGHDHEWCLRATMTWLEVIHDGKRNEMTVFPPTMAYCEASARQHTAGTRIRFHVHSRLTS